MRTTLEIDLATKLRSDIRAAMRRYFALTQAVEIETATSLSDAVSALTIILLEFEGLSGVSINPVITTQRKLMKKCGEYLGEVRSKK